MKLEAINPPSLGEARGYSNGILVPAGARLLLVAGQVGWDREHRFPDLVGAEAFVAQFARALDNVLEVVRAAGGAPTSLARLTVYVTDRRLYLETTRALGKVWKERLGRWYPAMALLEIKGLAEEGALLEMEATAFLDPVAGER